MKYIFTTIFFCLVMAGHAQTSFQGKIEYEVRAPGESMPAKLILSFGANKIKMEFIVPGKTSDNDYNIIDLDSGKVYTMDVRDKSYEVKTLQKNVRLPLPQSKEIAGHHTSPILLQPAMINADDEFLTSLNNGVFYAADDLYYSVPEMYTNQPRLMMVKNGKIVLGADIIDPVNAGGQWNLNKTVGWGTRDTFLIKVMATAIQLMRMDISLFIVPANFTERSKKSLIDERANYQKDSLDNISIPRARMDLKKKPSKPLQKEIPLAKPSPIHHKKD